MKSWEKVSETNHIRRINTEEKAKVIAAVWGTEFIQFLAALTIFNRTNSSFSSNHPVAVLKIVLMQNSQLGKEFNKFCPSNSSDDLCLFFWISSLDGPNTERQWKHVLRVCRIKWRMELIRLSACVDLADNLRIILAGNCMAGDAPWDRTVLGLM